MLIRINYVLSKSNQRGVTLIELVIALAILGGLFALASPFVGQMINNARIRTAAESIQSGLQLARSSAVNQNAQVQFVLTTPLASGTTDSSWTVGCVVPAAGASPCPAVIQARRAVEGTGLANGTSLAFVAPTIATVIFNGFGALTAATTAGLPAATANTASTANFCVGLAGVSLTSTYSTNSERRLKVVVGTGGAVRLCDPALSYPDPQACLLSPTAVDPYPC